jgi:TonB family protein
MVMIICNYIKNSLKIILFNEIKNYSLILNLYFLVTIKEITKMKNNLIRIVLLIIISQIFILKSLKSQSESQPKESEIYYRCDQMPVFPGCELFTSEEEREACSNKKLINYIYQNLKYPVEALTNNVTGKVVVKFVIDSTGTITSVEILKDIGANCGETVKQLIENMNDITGKWTPGIQACNKVSVYYTLPVTFIEL